jgi:cytochrome c-type biogenesis protein CcmH/NrfG
MDLENDRISQSTDRVVGVGNRLISAIELLAKNQKDHQQALEESSKVQSKQQKSIVALTVVIAVCTVIYTAVTVWSTKMQYEQLKVEVSLNKTE